jgi:hypothetical protein
VAKPPRVVERVGLIVDEGEMDLVKDFTPICQPAVTADMLDVPFEDVQQWRRWLYEIARFLGKVSYLFPPTPQS